MPNAQTVAIESIFAMLNMGYSTIYLYGVDHTFLEGLKVNDKNELVHVYQHFYENEPKIIPVPMLLVIIIHLLRNCKP